MISSLFQKTLKSISIVMEIPEFEIIKPNRNRKFVIARAILVAQLRKKGWAWQQISRALNIHHSTAIYHYQKYYDDYEYNILFRFLATQVNNNLNGVDFLTMSDLNDFIIKSLNSNNYYNQQDKTAQSILTYLVFTQCGYPYNMIPKRFLAWNILSFVDKHFINQMYNQVKVFVNAPRISEKAS